MSEPLSTSYDDIPYDSKPHRATHPDSMGTLASFLGMSPAPIERCRVLELGCATGGNLIPQAATLPESRFMGIDLSVKQIENARNLSLALGLANIDFKAASILDVDEGYGLFDYIICHGVYSWVPEAVRDKILKVCKSNLAPQGVAYVSYNTYPGWHFRGPVRDMMNFHVRRFEDPKTRVQQARALLKFLAQAVPDQQGPYALLLKEEAQLLDERADYYLFHEHLEDENRPFYFHEFMERAGAHGLQYLGEARSHSSMADLPVEVQQTLRQLSSDRLHLEQYLDFLRNRTFRRTLLVHDSVSLNRAPHADIVSRFKFSALAFPVANDPEVRSAKIEHFQTEEKCSCSTSQPVVKAMLVTLYRAWPGALTFAEILDAVGTQIDPMPEGQLRPFLAKAVVQFYLNALVEMHMHVPEFTARVSERPLAYPLARRQAAAGGAVATLRHTVAQLNALDRLILRHLDGTRDHTEVLHTLEQYALENDLELQKDALVVRDPAQVRDILKNELDPILEKLARSCLLVK
jgi:methyltransferase-like protein/SAM-dependent methyltransferase